MRWLVCEPVWRIAIVDPTTLASGFRVFNSSTVSLLTKIQPEACIYMIRINHSKDEAGKHSQVTLSLLTQILKHELQNKLLWLLQPINVEYSDQFKPIVINTLLSVKTWNGRQAIYHEIPPVIKFIKILLK